MHPIAVGEVFRCLISRICCSAVRPRLVDILIPYGQVGVGVKGGLEAAIHATCCCLHHYGSDPDLCLLIPGFPSEIRRPSTGLDLLGSPVWGSEDLYNSYTLPPRLIGPYTSIHC